MKIKDWIGLSMMILGFFIMDSGMTQYGINIAITAVGFSVLMIGTSIFVRG